MKTWITQKRYTLPLQSKLEKREHLKYFWKFYLSWQITTIRSKIPYITNIFQKYLLRARFFNVHCIYIRAPQGRVISAKSFIPCIVLLKLPYNMNDFWSLHPTRKHEGYLTYFYDEALLVVEVIMPWPILKVRDLQISSNRKYGLRLTWIFFLFYFFAIAGPINKGRFCCYTPISNRSACR